MIRPLIASVRVGAALSTFLPKKVKCRYHTPWLKRMRNEPPTSLANTIRSGSGFPPLEVVPDRGVCARGRLSLLLIFLIAFLERFLSVSSCQRCFTISRKRRRAAFRCAISSVVKISCVNIIYKNKKSVSGGCSHKCWMQIAV